MNRNLGKWAIPGVPHKGWTCLHVTDLGEPSAVCEMCEKQVIRYVHRMQHLEYPEILNCGCVCAGSMEGDLDGAIRRDKDARRRSRQRRRSEGWLSDARWAEAETEEVEAETEEHVVSLHTHDFGVELRQEPRLWAVHVNCNVCDMRWSLGQPFWENEQAVSASFYLIDRLRFKHRHTQ